MVNDVSKWKVNSWYITGILLVLLLTLSYKPVYSYLKLNYAINNLVVLVLPLIVFVKRPGEKSYRYGIVASMLLILFHITASPFMLVLAIGSAAFFVLEVTQGKITPLSPFALVLITPLAKYFFDVFGFPIRLELTKLAVNILSLINFDYSAQGNMIYNGESQYSVDTACMGLKLVITSLLICLLFISLLERKKKADCTLKGIVIFLIFTLFTVLISNLARIIFLVAWDSSPDSFSHQVIGVGSLIVFVVIPQYIFINKSNSYFQRRPNSAVLKEPLKMVSVISSIVLIGFVSIKSLFFNISNDIPFEERLKAINFPGYTSELLSSNVLALESPYSLIYIKPRKKYYNANHEPFMCWRGSGYGIYDERIEQVQGYDLCFASLIKEDKKIFTAWFYDNGDHKTTNQLDWRWRSLKGEDGFWLVNVSSENKYVLQEEIQRFLDKKVFPASN